MINTISSSLLTLATLVVVTNPQKVPPGVNPNTYQQPVQTQQYQQPPPPPPQQYQPPQPPVHSAVPIQAEHPPPMQGHLHDHHAQPQLLNTANLAEEREHMQEHLNVNIDTSKMSEQELQFHYFKMHDADNNNKLDGCELIKSLIHWHENEDEEHAREEPPPKSDEELSAIVDHLLETMDKDNDGYIDWFEYLDNKGSMD